MRPFVSTFMIWPKTTPPTVLKMNATSPRRMMTSVRGWRKYWASIVAPTASPRKIVVMFRISFWAARLRRSVAPHSRSRLPNISMPTRGTEAGRTSPVTTVQMIGKRIFSRLLTGRSCPMRMALSFFVVSSLMTGGWMRGTRDM